jgi:uncharacterized membrane protein YagU involved in acid resistance
MASLSSSVAGQRGDAKRNSAAKAIGMAGLLCGVMDITAALVVYGAMGHRPQRLLQGITSVAIGLRAFSGGLATAALGLFFHFVVAFGAATMFYLASRRMRFLVQRTVLFGAFYGVAVYFFMDRVVIPLFSHKPRPFDLKSAAIGVVIHIFCVGLPIAFMVRKYGSPVPAQ